MANGISVLDLPAPSGGVVDDQHFHIFTIDGRDYKIPLSALRDYLSLEDYLSLTGTTELSAASKANLVRQVPELSANEIIAAGGFFDDFDRPDTAAGTLGTNPQGWAYNSTGNGAAECSIVDGRVVRSVFGSGATYHGPIKPGGTSADGLGFIPREFSARVRWVRNGVPGEAVSGQPGATYAGNTPCAFLNQWRDGSINPKTHILATIASHHLQYWGDGVGSGTTLDSYRFDDVVTDGQTTTLRMIFWPELNEVWMVGHNGARKIISVPDLADEMNELWYFESLYSDEASGTPSLVSSWEPQFETVWAYPANPLFDQRLIEEFIDDDKDVPSKTEIAGSDMVYFRGPNGGFRKADFNVFAKAVVTQIPPLAPIAYWRGADYSAPTLPAVIGQDMTHVDDGNTPPEVSGGNLLIANDAVETADPVIPETGDFTIVVRGGFTAGSTQKNIFGQGENGNTTGTLYFRHRADLSPANGQFTIALDGTDCQKQTLTEMLGDTLHDIVITRSGTNVVIYIDDDAGAIPATLPTVSDIVTQASGFRLGKITGAAGSGGFVRYALVFDKVLTGTERTEIRTWMDLKDS